MSPLLRLLGFFALAWVLLVFLRALPGVGVLFRGFFAFWFVVIALSIVLERLSAKLQGRRTLQAELRSLGNVESPHNQGKLGSLLLVNGRARDAVECLSRAVQGEPERAEWHYRLGQALLRGGQAGDAAAPLERAAEIDEEHAYGGVQLALAEAYLALEQHDAALARIKTFDRNHGPSPESAYRRGQAHKYAGRKEQAADAFLEVASLAKNSAGYQKKDHGRWVAKAQWARIF